jgi:hypothetical protein
MPKNRNSIVESTDYEIRIFHARTRCLAGFGYVGALVEKELQFSSQFGLELLELFTSSLGYRNIQLSRPSIARSQWTTGLMLVEDPDRAAMSAASPCLFAIGDTPELSSILQEQADSPLEALNRTMYQVWRHAHSSQASPRFYFWFAESR